MTFSVTILGNASAMPTKEHYPTSQVLNVHERFFLIDCGEGVQMQLRRCGISALKIEAIFISHLHGDHIFGLYGLLSTMSMLGRTNGLPIYAPEKLKDVLNDYLKYFGEGMSFVPIVHAIDTNKPMLIYENDFMTVHTIPLIHRIPTSGFMFREKTPKFNIYKNSIARYNLSINDIKELKNGKDVILANGKTISSSEAAYLPYQGRSYAFCSDTAFSEQVIEQVENIDLLYHETTYQSDRKDLAHETMHSTAVEAAVVAQKAGAKKLLIGHFSSRYSDERGFLQEAQAIFPNTEIAKERETFEVPLIKVKIDNIFLI